MSSALSPLWCSRSESDAYWFFLMWKKLHIASWTWYLYWSLSILFFYWWVFLICVSGYFQTKPLQRHSLTGTIHSLGLLCYKCSVAGGLQACQREEQHIRQYIVLSFHLICPWSSDSVEETVTNVAVNVQTFWNSVCECLPQGGNPSLTCHSRLLSSCVSSSEVCSWWTRCCCGGRAKYNEDIDVFMSDR